MDVPVCLVLKPAINQNGRLTNLAEYHSCAKLASLSKPAILSQIFKDEFFVPLVSYNVSSFKFQMSFPIPLLYRIRQTSLYVVLTKAKEETEKSFMVIQFSRNYLLMIYSNCYVQIVIKIWLNISNLEISLYRIL